MDVIVRDLFIDRSQLMILFFHCILIVWLLVWLSIYKPQSSISGFLNTKWICLIIYFFNFYKIFVSYLRGSFLTYSKNWAIILWVLSNDSFKCASSTRYLNEAASSVLIPIELVTHNWSSSIMSFKFSSQL